MGINYIKINRHSQPIFFCGQYLVFITTCFGRLGLCRSYEKKIFRILHYLPN